MDELFSLIVEEIPGYLAAVAGSIEAGGRVYSHAVGAIDLAEKQEALVKMMQHYRDAYEGVGGAIDLAEKQEALAKMMQHYLDAYEGLSGAIDLAEKQEALAKMVQYYLDAYEGLGGAIDLGSNDELLITASRVYLLIKIDHRKRRFVAVLLSSSGNIGYLRFRIRDYLRQVSTS